MIVQVGRGQCDFSQTVEWGLGLVALPLAALIGRDNKSIDLAHTVINSFSCLRSMRFWNSRCSAALRLEIRSASNPL